MKDFSPEECVLVLAPTGSDAANSIRVLQQHGQCALQCADVTELCAVASKGVGAMLIAEEALAPASLPPLLELFSQQPSWSDIPLALITGGGNVSSINRPVVAALVERANVTLLERPFRLITLVSTVQVALRARRRQYQVRRLLKQHEADQGQLREHALELEQRVEERTAKLAETISELEAFSYSVSHDLRAPLRTMQGYSHYLLEDAGPTLNAECKYYVERIAASARRLDGLVQDILRYSRIARGDIHTEPIEVDKLVREIVEQYPTFQLPNAEVVIAQPLRRVLGHEASLTQCISNLLGNAVKFVPPGVQPRVEISDERRGDYIRVWFKDNGIGIAPEAQPRIFKMFERVFRDGDNYEGTGIGLAIVRKAVERMGGTVGVDSKLGTGSAFWIDLPKGE